MARRKRMEASDWMYIGEGGKHAVFAYRGSSSGDEKKWNGRVLRIPKGALRVAPPESDVLATCDATGPLIYIREVVKPLLGHYVDVPEVIQLEWEFVASLRDQTLSEGVIPSSRQHQWKPLKPTDEDKAIPAPAGHLMCSYRHNKRNSHCCISMEIKPKAGYTAFSPLVNPLNRMKLQKTRFDILQQLHCNGRISKGWNNGNDEHATVQPSAYNPLDLFSEESNKMKRALSAMVTTPQNNMRIWIDDTAVLGSDAEEAHDDTPLKRAVELLLPPNECRDDCDKTFREAFFDALTTCAALILHQEGLLHKLLALQRLDVVDADGAILIFERQCDLCGDCKAVEMLDSPSPLQNHGLEGQHVLGESPFQKPLSCPALDALLFEIDAFATKLNSSSQLPTLHDMDEALKRGKGHVKSLTKEACVYLLKNWLLSLVMCDVSFFLRLDPITSSEDLNECGISTQDVQKNDDETARIIRCQTESSPGVLVTSKRAFAYTLKVVDCDQKPACKLHKRREKEAAIRFYKEE